MLKSLRKLLGDDGAPRAETPPPPPDDARARADAESVVDPSNPSELPTEQRNAGGPISRHAKVSTTLLGQAIVATITDPELHAEHAADVADEIRQIYANAHGVRHLVLDMENIKYLDSAGLNAFVDLLGMVKQKGGAIGVAAATQQVQVLFKLTRLELVFLIRRDVLEAVEACERAG